MKPGLVPIKRYYLPGCTRHSTETLRVNLAHVGEALYYMEKAVLAEN